MVNSLSLQTVTVLSTKMSDRLIFDAEIPNGLTKISTTQPKTTTTTLRSGLIMQFVLATSYTKPTLFFKN